MQHNQTPTETGKKHKHNNLISEAANPTLYKSLVLNLLYLFMMSDIMYIVVEVSRYVEELIQEHSVVAE